MIRVINISSPTEFLHAAEFLYAKAELTQICSKDLRSVMLRIFLGFYVYDDF